MAALAPGLLQAQEVPRGHLYDRFQLSASGTLLLLGAKVRIDPETGEGTEIDLEDRLDIGTTTLQPRLALRWRPGRRHELEGGYQWASRSGETVLRDTIVFGDTTYAAGLRVNSTAGSSQAFLTYRYAFTAKEKTQIGAALGVGIIFSRNEITATAGATAGGPIPLSPNSPAVETSTDLMHRSEATVVSSSASDGTWRVTCGRSTSRSTTSRPA